MPTVEGITDVNYYLNQAVYYPFYSSPVSSPVGSPTSNYVLLGPCLVNCPNVSPGPTNGPGIYLWDDYAVGYMPLYYPDTSPYYMSVSGINAGFMVVGQDIAFVGSPIISPGNPDDALLFATGPVSLTYTVSYKYLRSTSTHIHYAALVGALYLASPYLTSGTVVLLPITFYVLPSPIGVSPGDVITVSVTLTFPNAIPA